MAGDQSSPAFFIRTHSPLPTALCAPSSRGFVIGVVFARRRFVALCRPNARRRLEFGSATASPRRPPPITARPGTRPAIVPTFGRPSILAVAGTTFVHPRPTAKHLLSTRRQYGLERFNPVVGRLQKEVLHDGFGTLELADQHLGVRTARHLPAHLRDDPIPARTVQNHEDAPLSRLHEVRGLGHLMLRDPCRSPPFPFCHGFGCLPERRSKEYTLFTFWRSPHPRNCSNPVRPETGRQTTS